MTKTFPHISYAPRIRSPSPSTSTRGTSSLGKGKPVRSRPVRGGEVHVDRRLGLRHRRRDDATFEPESELLRWVASVTSQDKPNCDEWTARAAAAIKRKVASLAPVTAMSREVQGRVRVCKTYEDFKTMWPSFMEEVMEVNAVTVDVEKFLGIRSNPRHGTAFVHFGSLRGTTLVLHLDCFPRSSGTLWERLPDEVRALLNDDDVVKIGSGVAPEIEGTMLRHTIDVATIVLKMKAMSFFSRPDPKPRRSGLGHAAFLLWGINPKGSAPKDMDQFKETYQTRKVYPDGEPRWMSIFVLYNWSVPHLRWYQKMYVYNENLTCYGLLLHFIRGLMLQGALQMERHETFNAFLLRTFRDLATPDLSCARMDLLQSWQDIEQQAGRGDAAAGLLRRLRYNAGDAGDAGDAGEHQQPGQVPVAFGPAAALNPRMTAAALD